MLGDQTSRTLPTSETPPGGRSRSELAVLYDTIRDVTSTLAVQEVLQRALDRTLVHLESEIGSILLLDRALKLRIMTAHGLPDEVIDDTCLAIGEGISGFVAEEAEPLLVPDVEQDQRFQRRNHERYYTRSCISAPLLLRGEVLGVFNVNNKRSREAYSEEDLALLQAIAGHVAVALGNARRYEAMMDRAQRDPLTGLWNHGHFWTLLETEVRRARRHRRPLSVLMLDVDRFKEFNDRHGHLAGDDALSQIARAIQQRCRCSDAAGRYGGEEFAVVLPETSLEGATAFCETLREVVESDGAGAGKGELTVSIGVSSFPDSGESATALLATADEALYRAKADGRNCVRASVAGARRGDQRSRL